MMAAKFSKSKPYRVRESAKAKHVSIKITHQGDVEIVVPRGFDRRKLAEILERRQDWIAKTTQRIEAERQSFPGDAAELGSGGTIPTRICLRAIDEDWTVQFQNAAGNPSVKTIAKRQEILLAASSPELAITDKLLRHWLTRRAEQKLVPWLRQLSGELNLPFQGAAVRGQKTLWASCSGKKNINLNYKLLFLPPHLVRYVLIHELCHTIHLNHSPSYWTLVSRKEPQYRELDAELNRAWVYVPEWVERSFE